MATTSTSTSPPPRPPPPAHTRTYQACIPCRRRKVRCDLGPVDNPREPPCVRCRRESKDCYFSATRRKKRADGDDDDEAGEISDYEIRNGRKRPRTGTSIGDNQEVHPHEPLYVNSHVSPTHGTFPGGATALQQPLTPGGSVGRLQPLRRPNTQGSAGLEEEDQKVNNATTAMLQTAEVYSGHDALNLLFEAATGRGEDMMHHHHRRTTSASSLPRPTTMATNTPGSQPSFSSPQTSAVRSQFASCAVPDSAVDPAISQPYPNGTFHRDSPAREQALKAWSRFRFVRAGWFTAIEAMDYMQYFRDCLSPLTPIVVPDFSDYSKHAKFLTEEPMLVVTILTISTRYMKLGGPGASSRPYAIHEKLWGYLQGMVQRMIWGQEQFGGGFCGAGAQPGADVNPLLRKGLRTLGTVESLMLLTEWHPRALHFPPGDEDHELMTPEDPVISEGTHGARLGSGGERVDSWLEPCWRSDRMCWMLLGTAMSLAFEIGVFDETSESDYRDEFQGQADEEMKVYMRRRKVLRDLLLIYVTQTSGRLGVTSMLPKHSNDPNFSCRSDPRLQDRLASLRSANQAELDHILHGHNTTYSSATMQDRVLYFWREMSYFIESGNQRLFPNRRHTRELIKSGHYVELLQYFNPILREWRKNLEKAEIPQHMRYILLIEYEYNRVYVNSLALQAVVERCTNNTPAQTQAQQATENGAPNSGSSSKSTGNAIPWATLTEWYGDDRPYISEVIEASRNVLRIVIEGLYPGDFLKHAPVRTYFRIISVAIILLKTFVLGATADDVAISLGLLDRAVEALRTCIVDDVHVANNFADLCEKLTQRIRTRFIRVAGHGGNGSAGVSRTGSPRPMLASAPSGVGGDTFGSSSMLGPSAASMGPPLQVPGGGPGVGGSASHSHNQPRHLSPWSGLNEQHSIPGSPAMNSGGRGTPNYSALWGISTESYDPGRNDVSIMPPPSFELYDVGGGAAGGSGSGDNSGGMGDSHPDGPTGGVGSLGAMNVTNGGEVGADEGGDGSGGAMPDWLAIPLDPLLNSYGADVTQRTYGPNVGDTDLLDLLLYEWD